MRFQQLFHQSNRFGGSRLSRHLQIFWQQGSAVRERYGLGTVVIDNILDRLTDENIGWRLRDAMLTECQQ